MPAYNPLRFQYISSKRIGRLIPIISELLTEISWTYEGRANKKIYESMLSQLFNKYGMILYKKAGIVDLTKPLNDLIRLGLVELVDENGKIIKIFTTWRENMKGQVTQSGLDFTRTSDITLKKQKLGIAIIKENPIYNQLMKHIGVKFIQKGKVPTISDVAVIVEKICRENKKNYNFHQIEKWLLDGFRILESLLTGQIQLKKSGNTYYVLVSKHLLRETRIISELYTMQQYKCALIKSIIEFYRKRGTLDLIISGQWSPYYVALVDIISDINRELGVELDLEQHINTIRTLAKLDNDITFIVEKMSIIRNGPRKYHFVAISLDVLKKFLQ